MFLGIRDLTGHSLQPIYLQSYHYAVFRYFILLYSDSISDLLSSDFIAIRVGNSSWPPVISRAICAHVLSKVGETCEPITGWEASTLCISCMQKCAGIHKNLQVDSVLIPIAT